MKIRGTNIYFKNGTDGNMHDVTQFDAANRTEIAELWLQFCLDEGIIDALEDVEVEVEDDSPVSELRKKLLEADYTDDELNALFEAYSVSEVTEKLDAGHKFTVVAYLTEMQNRFMGQSCDDSCIGYLLVKMGYLSFPGEAPEFQGNVMKYETLYRNAKANLGIREAFTEDNIYLVW